MGISAVFCCYWGLGIYMLYKSNKSPNLIKIKHKTTGEEFVIDASVSRYERLGKGFLNKMRFSHNSFLKHITLTQKTESYHPRILNNFFSAVRRYYGDVIYIWTAEIQEFRSEKFGDKVLHWHVLIAFDNDIQFGRDDVIRLQKYWKYGNLDIRPVRKPSVSYLMKYITKSLGSGFGKIRRVGSSCIEAYYRQGLNALISAIMFFGGLVPLSEYYWYRGRAYLYENVEHQRGRIYIYNPPRQWEVVGWYEAEAF